MKKTARSYRGGQAAAVLIGILLGVGPLHAKEGFGMTKLTVQLRRVRPPDVYIAETEISVLASGQGIGGSAEAQLISALEVEVLGNDTRLKLAIGQPGTVIEVALLDNDFKEHWETRAESRLVRTGTNSKGKPTYGRRQVSVRYKVIDYVFRVAFKVRDLPTGATLAADTLAPGSRRDYENGTGAPSRAQAELTATTWAVSEIARRLTPTTETIGVLIPKGSLKDASPLAKAGLWNRYLETLEGLGSQPRGEHEAYRQYGIGVAYEALGYGTEEPETALSYLEQASLHYNAALASNPKEKYFTGGFQGSGFMSNLKSQFSLGNAGQQSAKQAMAPVERVASALEQYQRIVDFKDSDGLRPASLDGAKGDLGGGEGAVTNSAVIDMTKAGLPEEVILATIELAARTDLSSSPSALIELAEANVSTEIILRIQAIANSDQD